MRDGNGKGKKEEIVILKKTCTQGEKLIEEAVQEVVQKSIVLEKAPHIAVCSYFKCHCMPFKDSDGRVRFEVSGPVSEALSAIQNNVPIPIGDFLSRLESVRSLIFSLKGSRTGL